MNWHIDSIGIIRSYIKCTLTNFTITIIILQQIGSQNILGILHLRNNKLALTIFISDLNCCLTRMSLIISSHI